MNTRPLLLSIVLLAACDRAPEGSGLPDAEEARPTLEIEASPTDGAAGTYESRLLGTLALDTAAVKTSGR